ncbi:MAG: ABC transporter ATP-binding protein [Bacteroidota bacterium]
MLLEIEQLTKTFDAGRVKALAGVSLQLAAGKSYSILGESGSGKTTLARLIAGLERPDEGTISLEGTLISSIGHHLPAEERPVGFVFQSYALFPHLSVDQNIAYGISSLPNRQALVAEMLQLVGLEGYGHRYPHELSGGQQQRVAVARAMARKPELLLLDEPFSNLDSTLRIGLRDELFKILQRTGVTSVFITHNAEDALAISDEIIVLQDGQLLQQATPQHLYQQPATPYVAQLFAPLLPLSADLLAAFDFQPAPNQHYFLREHDFRINQIADYQTEATVRQTTFMGRYYILTLQVGDQLLQIQTPEPAAKEVVTLSWTAADLLVF